jgi:HAD superfamily hydrolase (TIGR01509 family)
LAKHIIFDCDGVILDTEIVAAEVMSAWLNKLGVEIGTEQFIRQYTGRTFSSIIQELQEKELLGSNFSSSKEVELIELNVKNNIRLIDGIQEALQQIETPKSIVSNSSLEYVKSATTRLGIDHHFEDRFFSSEQVEQPKPSPMVYELAVREIGVSKRDILVIEDSISGVLAAVSAGLEVIGFLGGSHILDGHGELLLNAGALKTVDSHSALVKLFSRL